MKKVDIIAAENIKRTLILLNHFNIKKKIIPFNKNNEKKQTSLITKIIKKKKKKIALVSSAGTPLINDPGLLLIQKCYEKKIPIISLPGACSLIASLVISGISSKKFFYEGFLSKKKKKKEKTLKKIKNRTHTTILLESPNRILSSLKKMSEILKKTRKIAIIRELTKTWETIYKGNILKIFSFFKKNQHHCKGELVLIINGKKKKKKEVSHTMLKTFNLLNKHLSINKSLYLVSKIYNTKKNKLYKYIILKKKQKLCYYKNNKS